MKHIMPFLVFFLLLSACEGNSPALADVTATATATPPPSPTNTESANQSLPSAPEPSPTPKPIGILFFDPARFQVVSVPLKPDMQPYPAGGPPQIPSLFTGLVFDPAGEHFAVKLPWYWNAATDVRLCVNPSEKLTDGSLGAYSGPSFSLLLYDLFNWAHNVPLKMDATLEDATKYCTSIKSDTFGSSDGPYAWNQYYAEVGIGYRGSGGNLLEAIILDFNGANVGGGEESGSGSGEGNENPCPDGYHWNGLECEKDGNH